MQLGELAGNWPIIARIEATGNDWMADMAVIWRINRIGSVGSQWAPSWFTTIGI
jgi:hypothetical protein